MSFFLIFYILGKAGEGLGQDVTRGGEVDADIMLGAVHLRWIEEDVRITSQVMTEGLGRNVERRYIDPSEVGAFRLMELQHRQMLMEKITEETEIGIDVLVQFVQPSLRLVIRSDLCN